MILQWEVTNAHLQRKKKKKDTAPVQVRTFSDDPLPVGLIMQTSAAEEI
jgi:hypothetical protein